MPYRRDFLLPPFVADLVAARNRLRDHYASTSLSFTLDGNLVGDIGEAIAVELFGIALTDRNGAGIDGQVNGRSVQIKATGTGRGPAFRVVDARADHLIFLNIDFETLQGEVVFNGPEEIALKSLPTTWIGQRSLTRSQILAADKLVPTEDRLRRIDN